MYYITSVPYCYKYLLQNALSRIDTFLFTGQSIDTSTFNKDKTEIQVCLIPAVMDDHEDIQGTIVHVRNFINGFIAGCEYCHTHGTNERKYNAR